MKLKLRAILKLLFSDTWLLATKLGNDITIDTTFNKDDITTSSNGKAIYFK